MDKVTKLRKIAVVMDVSGALKEKEATELYKDSFGFVLLQCYVPVTQNRDEGTTPQCTVQRAVIDNFGNPKETGGEMYYMEYVDVVEYQNARYMLFERLMPKAFTDTAGKLSIVFNYRELCEDKSETARGESETKYYISSRLTSRPFTIDVKESIALKNEPQAEEEASVISGVQSGLGELKSEFDSLKKEFANVDGSLETLLSGTICDNIDGTGTPGVTLENGKLKFDNLRGKQGEKGDTAEITIGKVESVGFDENPSVENSGTKSDAVLNFKLPQGKPASVKIGKVQTVAPDEKPRVENVGSDNEPVLDFYIPLGFKIQKAYSSITAMNEGFATDTDIPLWGLVIIDTGDVNDEDNAKIFTKGETGYLYLADLSGAQGIIGPDGPKGDRGATALSCGGIIRRNHPPNGTEKLSLHIANCNRTPEKDDITTILYEDTSSGEAYHLALKVTGENDGTFYECTQLQHVKVSVPSEFLTVELDAADGETSGAVSDDTLALLQNNKDAVLLFDGERYSRQSNQADSDFLVFTHLGYSESGEFIVKAISITLSAKSWMLGTQKVGESSGGGEAVSLYVHNMQIASKIIPSDPTVELSVSYISDKSGEVTSLKELYAMTETAFLPASGKYYGYGTSYYNVYAIQFMDEMSMMFYLYNEYDTITEPCGNDFDVTDNVIPLALNIKGKDGESGVAYVAEPWEVPSSMPALQLGVTYPIEGNIQPTFPSGEEGIGLGVYQYCSFTGDNAPADGEGLYLAYWTVVNETHYGRLQSLMKVAKGSEKPVLYMHNIRMQVPFDESKKDYVWGTLLLGREEPLTIVKELAELFPLGTELPLNMTTTARGYGVVGLRVWFDNHFEGGFHICIEGFNAISNVNGGSNYDSLTYANVNGMTEIDPTTAVTDNVTPIELPLQAFKGPKGDPGNDGDLPLIVTTALPPLSVMQQDGYRDVVPAWRFNREPGREGGKCLGLTHDGYVIGCTAEMKDYPEYYVYWSNGNQAVSIIGPKGDPAVAYIAESKEVDVLPELFNGAENEILASVVSPQKDYEEGINQNIIIAQAVRGRVNEESEVAETYLYTMRVVAGHTDPEPTWDCVATSRVKVSADNTSHKVQMYMHDTTINIGNLLISGAGAPAIIRYSYVWSNDRPITSMSEFVDRFDGVTLIATGVVNTDTSIAPLSQSVMVNVVFGKDSNGSIKTFNLEAYSSTNGAYKFGNIANNNDIFDFEISDSVTPIYEIDCNGADGRDGKDGETGIAYFYTTIDSAANDPPEHITRDAKLMYPVLNDAEIATGLKFWGYWTNTSTGNTFLCCWNIAEHLGVNAFVATKVSQTQITPESPAPAIVALPTNTDVGTLTSAQLENLADDNAIISRGGFLFRKVYSTSQIYMYSMVNSTSAEQTSEQVITVERGPMIWTLLSNTTVNLKRIDSTYKPTVQELEPWLAYDNTRESQVIYWAMQDSQSSGTAIGANINYNNSFDRLYLNLRQVQHDTGTVTVTEHPITLFKHTLLLKIGYGKSGIASLDFYDNNIIPITDDNVFSRLYPGTGSVTYSIAVAGDTSGIIAMTLDSTSRTSVKFTITSSGSSTGMSTSTAGFDVINDNVTKIG